MPCHLLGNHAHKLMPILIQAFQNYNSYSQGRCYTKVVVVVIVVVIVIVIVIIGKKEIIK